jgi:hypothetical protein
MPSTFLQHLLLVQGGLLAVTVGLFLGHGLWLAWYTRRCQAAWAPAQAIAIAALGGATLSPTERAWLCTVPVRLQIRLFAHLAHNLSGTNKQELTGLARALGLLTRAETLCLSTWWWRRLQGARLLTLLGGGEHIVPTLFLDHEALVRGQAAEWAMEHPTPAVLQALLTMLGDVNGLCRFTAQDTLIHLGQVVTEPLARVLSVSAGLQVETALVVAVGLAGPCFFKPALRLSHSAAPGVRALAVTLLGALGGREGVQVLTALLDDDASEVRVAAAHALGKLHHWPAAAALAGLLRDRAWSVRREAGLALRALGSPGLLFLRRSLQDADAFAADMARQVLDLPDTASLVEAI